MFTLIEHARMAVGVKSMAALSTAYLNALTHARNRVQGADRPGAADEAAPPALIVECPDARRMLMAQKAHAEGMRALALFTASVQDEVERAGGPGAAAGLEALNGLLLPLVKGYCSEKAYEILALSLQTCGASGYTEDYPVEQYIRDQKIDTLYEGTTHMQALDLVLRKIARDGGVALRELLGRIRATVDGLTADGPLSVERRALREALGELEAAFSALLAKLRESPYHAGLQGNRVLFALAEVVIGWLLIRHADVALRRREENPTDRDFYAGKLCSARWWCRNVLPSVGLTRHLVESSTLELMAMANGCF